MLEPSGDLSETMARRGTTLQQGSDHGQNHGVGDTQLHGRDGDTAGPTASSGRGFMPHLVLPLLPWHSGDISIGPCTVLSSQAQGHRTVEIQGDFDIAAGQSDKTGGPQTARPAAQQIPIDVAQLAPKQGCRGSLGWGQCQPPHHRDVPTARGAQATTSRKANHDEGLGKQSHWQQEPPMYSHVAG